MTIARRIATLAMVVCLGLSTLPATRADVVGPAGGFTATGSVGFRNGLPINAITYGGDGQGSVYQMNGYVNIPGVTTGNNGSTFNSADLDQAPPPGVGYTFAASQPTKDQLLLSYQFINNSGSNLAGFQFLYYVDPDDGNNDPNSDGLAYTREYAMVKGSLGLTGPTSYQVGDPGSSSIFTNIGNGTLNNQNDFPNSGTLGDVSVALGFNVGNLGIGQATTVDILLSDDGSSLGNFSITQISPGDYPNDSLTISGAVVPEPSSLILMGFGSAAVFGSLARKKRRVQAWTKSQ